MKMKHLLVVSASLFALLGWQQAWSACLLSNISFSPTSPRTGQKFKITVYGQGTGTTQILYSRDGGSPQPLMGLSSFPKTAEVNGFSTAGNHTIKVWSTTSSGHPVKCSGQAQRTINVTPSLRPGAIKGGFGSASSCPNGWYVVPGSQEGGAFVCKPKKPYPKIKCPPKHQYFETDCTVGCKKLIY